MKKIIIFLTIFFFIGVSASAGINDGLVGYWIFDDPLQLGIDSSGNGNNGQITATDVEYTEAGMINGAAKFIEGVPNSAIRVPNSASLTLTSGITIAAWVKLDGVNTDDGNTVMSKSVAGAGVESYALFASYNPRSSRMAAWFYQTPIDSGYLLTIDSWTHIAMTYEGQTVRFYANGSLVSSIAYSGGLQATDADLQIGASPMGATEEFSGSMDEVRLYSRALSDAEIQELYKGEQGCSTWSDVISKYNDYVNGQAVWTDVITCYTEYVSHQ